jgi:hypothetical protein
MDFIKKHYDKVILSAVLLGVVGFLIFLPFLISHDQSELTGMTRTIINHKVQPLPPLDMTPQSDIMQRLKSPANFDFSAPNKLFNPLEWKRAADGSVFPIKTGNETGAGAATVTKITPLYFIISFDSVETNGATPRYDIGVEDRGAMYPAMRRKQPRFVSLDDPKKDVFTLKNVKGAPENPDELDLTLSDTGDTVSITPDKPYQHPDAYAADLRYDPERLVRTGLRVGSRILFGGGDYIVVAIDANEVVLFDQSNQKKTTLHYVP